MSNEFLQLKWFSNEVIDYFIALAILLVGTIAIKIISNFVLGRLKRRARRTGHSSDEAIVRISEKTFVPILYLGNFHLAIGGLTLNPLLTRAIHCLLIIIATFFGIRFFISLAEYFVRLYGSAHKTDNPNLEQSLNALIPAIKAVIWAIGIIFVLDNLGFNISAVVASLGIGGVAIALASQGVLQDLFSYFSILFDRPFEIGDLIIIGEFIGTVEQVGIKTTRLRSLGGEQLVLANTDITGSRIRNLKRMEKRRVLFKLGVVYETPSEKLEIIPSIIEQIVKKEENAIFDRAHFNNYGDFSLDFEIVYFVTGRDYKLYMDVRHQINLQIKQEFEKHGIEFAYPTEVSYQKY